MSDRLRELLRQRTLLQEHLTWLEREIKAAGGAAPPDTAAQPVPAAAAANVPPPPAPAAAPTNSPKPTATVPDDLTAGAEDILKKYRVEPRSVQQDVRRGCLLYFVVGFMLFSAGVLGLYYALRSP